MRTFDDEPIRLYRGPGWFSVFVISLVTSFAVAVGVEWAIQRGLFPALRNAATQASPQPSAQQPAPPARAAAAAPAAERGATVIKVPMIAGMPLAMATQQVEARGLKLVVREKRQHDELPADTVITQDPLPESPVAPKSPVSVAISAGKAGASAQLPDVTGQSLEQAAQTLAAAGFKLGAVAGPDAGPRVVKSTEPAAGQPAAAGSAVALTLVASGVVVPKLVGLPWGKAKKALEASGLNLGKLRERFDEDHSSWVVLEQTPLPGTQVAAGTGVDIVRNEGD